MSIDLYRVKNDVERLVCSKHMKHPSVQVMGSKFNINCCCEEFQQKCIQESQKALANEGRRAITETLNKAFKGLK